MNTTVQEKIEVRAKQEYSNSCNEMTKAIRSVSTTSANQTISTLQEDQPIIWGKLRQSGADLVIAEPVNNDNDPKYERRVKIIAKKAGYAVTRKDEKKE